MRSQIKAKSNDTLISQKGYSEQIANSELAIIPGVHGEYIEEIATLKSNSKEAEFVIPMIESFLDKASLI
jgi:hypothetical protein